ncbi:MAG: hypothetical protein ACI841_003193 [Planctomycetota bacterium]|jgi:hypothetical protein
MTHEKIQQVVSLLPQTPTSTGALPPDRRAALEPRVAQLRTAPPKPTRIETP